MPKNIAFDALPVRQRKFARTKLGLLNALKQQLRRKPFEEITIRALCDAVEISEASFFNYFPRKTDLLLYHIQLWSIEMAWFGRTRATADGGLAAIEDIFARSAAEVARHPALMAEIIASQARLDELPEFGGVSRAERLLAFPDLDGIEDVQGLGLDELLPPLLERAVNAGELPATTDRGAALIALAGIFLGLPVVLRRSPSGALAVAYQAQLRLLWAGLRASSEASQ